MISSGAQRLCVVWTVQQVTGMNEIRFTHKKQRCDALRPRAQKHLTAHLENWSGRKSTSKKIFVPSVRLNFGLIMSLIAPRQRAQKRSHRRVSAPLFLTHKIGRKVGRCGACTRRLIPRLLCQ